MSYAKYRLTNYYQVYIRFGESVFEVTKKDPARNIQSYFESCNLVIPCTDISGTGTGATGNLTLKDYDGKLFQVIVARAQNNNDLIRSLLMYYETQGDQFTDLSQIGETNNAQISVRVVIHTWSGTRGFNFYATKLNYTGLASGMPSLQMTLDFQAQNTTEGVSFVSQDILSKYNATEGIPVETPFEALSMLTKDFKQDLKFEKEPNVYVDLKDWNDSHDLKFFNNISNYRINFLTSEVKPNVNIVKSEMSRIVACMYDKENYNYTCSWKITASGGSVLIVKQTKEESLKPPVDVADCDVYPSQCIFTWYLSGTHKEIDVGSISGGTSTRKLAIPIESVDLTIDQNKIFEAQLTDTFTSPNGTFIFTPHGSVRTTESAASLKLRLSSIAAIQQIQGMTLQITVLNFITFDMNDKVEVAGYDALQQPSPICGVWKVTGNMQITLGPVVKTTVDLIFLDPSTDNTGGTVTRGILEAVHTMESDAKQAMFEKITQSVSSFRAQSYVATYENQGYVETEDGVIYDCSDNSMTLGKLTLSPDGFLLVEGYTKITKDMNPLEVNKILAPYGAEMNEDKTITLNKAVFDLDKKVIIFNKGEETVSYDTTGAVTYKSEDSEMTIPIVDSKNSDFDLSASSPDNQDSTYLENLDTSQMTYKELLCSEDKHPISISLDKTEELRKSGVLKEHIEEFLNTYGHLHGTKRLIKYSFIQKLINSGDFGLLTLLLAVANWGIEDPPSKWSSDVMEKDPKLKLNSFKAPSANHGKHIDSHNANDGGLGIAHWDVSSLCYFHALFGFDPNISSTLKKHLESIMTKGTITSWKEINYKGLKRIAPVYSVNHPDMKRLADNQLWENNEWLSWAKYVVKAKDSSGNYIFQHDLFDYWIVKFWIPAVIALKNKSKKGNHSSLQDAVRQSRAANSAPAYTCYGGSVEDQYISYCGDKERYMRQKGFCRRCADIIGYEC